MKFRKHLSGMKNKDGKPYVSGYDARVPAQALKQAGFLKDDGSLCDYEVHVTCCEYTNKLIIELHRVE